MREGEEVVRKLLEDYVRRAKVLRQIHGNKAGRADAYNRHHIGVTVVLASVVTYLGFAGTDASANLPKAIRSAVEAVTSGAGYAILVLFILVVSILGLFFRFAERSSMHYRSVELLTEFLRDTEDAIALSRGGVQRVDTSTLSATRLRYQGLLLALPPNTDKEYVKAKEDAKVKRNGGGDSRTSIPDWREAGGWRNVDPPLGDRLAAILAEAPRRALLETINNSLGSDYWLTGGAVRDAIWDTIHAHPVPTPVDDVDVIFFDKLRAEESHETQLVHRLASKNGNIRWSVKNQARMHSVNAERPSKSLSDAVSHFPETATALAVRLDEQGRLVILAPHGLSDLFAGIVRPTPHANMTSFTRRAAEKGWATTWPQLAIDEKGEKRSRRLARKMARVWRAPRR